MKTKLNTYSGYFTFIIILAFFAISLVVEHSSRNSKSIQNQIAKHTNSINKQSELISFIDAKNNFIFSKPDSGDQLFLFIRKNCDRCDTLAQKMIDKKYKV